MTAAELALILSQAPGGPRFWAPRAEFTHCFHCGQDIEKHEGKERLCPKKTSEEVDRG